MVSEKWSDIVVGIFKNEKARAISTSLKKLGLKWFVSILEAGARSGHLMTLDLNMGVNQTCTRRGADNNSMYKQGYIDCPLEIVSFLSHNKLN